jgi:DNA uptake protein ComE-like DNA-binding protein
MSVVSINTSSKQELMTLREIAEARAKLIIAAREAKGTLQLEDIKMIKGLPNTTWDPLVAAGKITFEIPEEQS